MQNSDEGFNEYATEDDREYLRNLMNESERLRENDDYDDDYDYDDAHRNIVRQGLRSSHGNNNNNDNNSADNEHIDDDDDDDRDDGFEEELSFAEVFRRVKERKLLATSAAKRFERICLIRADDLRAKIHHRNSDRTKQQHRVMRKVVVELEREAKTWNLVNHLFGDAMYEDRRAFEEDRVRCLASKRTMNGYEGDVMIPCLSVRERLIVRDEKRDPVLFRAQRILAWLEENQAQKLKREMFSSSNNNVTANKTASNTGTNFIDANCGTFKETALAVEQGSTQDYEGRELSERLDMDGVVVGNNSMITSDINNDYYYYSKSNNDNNNNNRNRNGSHGGSGKKGALHPVDAMNETKLLKKLWQILRSGNIEQARDLCIKCGQPWRAASLGGASGWSFVPVGENCERERLRDDARVHAVLRREERGLNKNGSFDEIPLHVQNELDAVDERVISECLMMKSKKKSGNNANNIDDDEENSGLVDHRRLWKWTLHKASRQLLSKLEDDTSYNNGGGDDALTRTERERLVYEAAIYASLCGDVDGMMHAAVAESDDDVLGSEISYTNGDSYDAIAWVLFRSIIDHCIDKKLMKKWDESVIGEYVDDFVNNNDCDGDDDDGINRATQCADFWASGFDVGKPIREDAGDDDDDDDDHDDGDDAEFNNNDNSNNNNAHFFDDYGPRWPTQEVLESCPTNPQAAFEVLEKLQSREGFETHRTIQKDLALGSIENIIKNVLCERIFSSAAVAAGRDDESTPRTFQRFAANFVLSLKDVLHAENDIERKEIEEKGDFFASRGLDYECDKIVGKYVITLISEQRYSLVSLYASQLNAHSRADILSKFYCIKSSSMSPKAKLKRHEECMEWIPLEGEGNRRDIVRKTLERSRFEEFSHVEAKWLNEVSQWATRDVNKDFAKEARSFACKLLRERALRRTFRAVEQTFIDANEGDNSFAQIGNDEYFNGESDALDLINSELKTFLLDPATIDFDNHEQQQQQQEEDEEDSYDSKNTRELIKWSKYFECCEMLKKWRATAKRNFVPPEEEVLYEVDGGGGEFNNINKAKRKERELRQRPFHDEEKRESDSALALKCVDKVFNLFNSPQRSFIWLHDKDDVDILLNDDDDNNDNENKEDFFWFRLTTDVYGFDEVEQELIAEKTDSFSEALREALTEENIKEEQIEEYSVQCEAKGEETIGIRAFLKLRYFQNMSNNNKKKENKDKNDVKIRTMRALSKVIKALYLDVNQFETSEDDDDHNGNSSSFFASKRLCEFVCVPSLLIQAAECEAWILTTTTTTTESAANNRITKLVADLYAETLFTNDELRRVLNFRALGAMREENNT